MKAMFIYPEKYRYPFNLRSNKSPFTSMKINLKEKITRSQEFQQDVKSKEQYEAYFAREKYMIDHE